MTTSIRTGATWGRASLYELSEFGTGTTLHLINAQTSLGESRAGPGDCMEACQRFLLQMLLQPPIQEPVKLSGWLQPFAWSLQNRTYAS